MGPSNKPPGHQYRAVTLDIPMPLYARITERQWAILTQAESLGAAANWSQETFFLFLLETALHVLDDEAKAENRGNRRVLLPTELPEFGVGS